MRHCAASCRHLTCLSRSKVARSMTSFNSWFQRESIRRKSWRTQSTKPNPTRRCLAVQEAKLPQIVSSNALASEVTSPKLSITKMKSTVRAQDNLTPKRDTRASSMTPSWTMMAAIQITNSRRCHNSSKYPCRSSRWVSLTCRSSTTTFRANRRHLTRIRWSKTIIIEFK